MATNPQAGPTGPAPITAPRPTLADGALSARAGAAIDAGPFFPPDARDVEAVWRGFSWVLVGAFVLTVFLGRGRDR